MRKVMNQIKKLSAVLSFILCAVIIVTSVPMEVQAAGKTKVASAQSKSDYSFKIKENNIMLPDPAYYSSYKITSSSKADDKGDYHSLKFNGGEDSFTIFEEYLRLLQEKFNFKQVDYYDFDYNNKTNFSYGFDYTGTADVCKGVKTIYNKVPCHLSIWGSKGRSSLEFYIEYSEPLILGDTGHRDGGKIVSRVPAGKSALTSLYKLNDGSYQTGDNRLKTKVGYATVLRDGKNIL